MTALLLRLRNRQFFVLDFIMLAILPSLALALRMDGFEGFPRHITGLIAFTLIGIVVRLAVFYFVGLYQHYWRYASINELVLIVKAVGLATIVNALIFFALSLLNPCSAEAIFPCLPPDWLPRSIPLIDSLLTLIAVGGVRFSVRLVETLRRRGRLRGRRVLIIGAGEAGVMIAKEVQNNPQLGLELVGFVDDDAAKHGMRIQGSSVHGGRERIPDVMRSHRVSQAIIAMPTAPGKTIRHYVDLCEKAGIQVKTIPGIYELLSGTVSVNQIRDIEIEDLLRREPVRIETDDIVRMLNQKRVLVTGAGGSIGMEICRQVARHGAAEIVLLGHGENSIFRAMRELDEVVDPALILHPVIADVRDKPRLKMVFGRFAPQIVFHAAAHKHVPLMEGNIEEAVSNNVLGTKSLIEVSEESDVERFVLVSSDKAVNPTSAMGVTKRVAELLVETAAVQNHEKRSISDGPIFLAVRFGNVLGSRGSVVEIFREQIARGGPVTVTHPDMRRFFMTCPEAVQLVLQAAAIGQGGDIFVLDMGEPVRIVDLATDLIELSGLRVGRDIDIEFIGPLPGEKLIEELFAKGERYARTAHEKCFVVRNGSVNKDAASSSQAGVASGSDRKLMNLREFEEQVDGLIQAAVEGETEKVRRLLQDIVPEYRPLAS
jgi:FlaA1/EpsC-like NDP-sugar epimerase